MLSNRSLDIYDKALSTNLLQSDVEQIVPVLLARSGYDRRQFEGSGGMCPIPLDIGPAHRNHSDEDRFVTLIATLETGIELVHKGHFALFVKWSCFKLNGSQLLRPGTPASAWRNIWLLS